MLKETMRDEELVEQCRTGDQEAFRMLIDRYEGRAMSLAISWLRNRADAEDICQDAFIRTFVNLDRIDVSRSFRTWFFTVLSNRCRDQLRMRGRYGRFVQRLKADTRSRGDIRPVQRTPGFKLDAAVLDQLSPHERTAVWLWAQEGCTGVEIASVLGCAPATARVHLYKARKKIKTYLEKAHAAL